MWTFETISYVVGIPSVIFCVLMLAGIAITISSPRTSESRFHVPRHAADEMHDPTHVMGADIEAFIQVGRHGLSSLVRYTRVASDWNPIMGSVRIALLETHTAEYLFARKPKDQLNTERVQFVRAYAYSG
jgi:hypothetical protein